MIDVPSKRRPAGATPEAVLAVCERLAEVQALLLDHIECGKHSAADVVAKAQAVLSEAARRMIRIPAR